MTTTIQSQSQFYLNQNSDLIPMKYQLNTEYQDIPCWELFTPNNRILTLYPTHQFTMNNV